MMTVGVSVVILAAIEITASWLVPVLFGHELRGP